MRPGVHNVSIVAHCINLRTLTDFKVLVHFQTTFRAMWRVQFGYDFGGLDAS
jgi:hypothetical protein